MTNGSIINKFKMVCNDPEGDGLTILQMPDFLLHDTMDNSIAHVHTFYEIIWFQETGGIHTVDFREFKVEKNMLLFLSPGQVHNFDGVTQHKGVSLKICSDLMKMGSFDENDFLKQTLFGNSDTEPICYIDEQTAEKLNSLIQKMNEEKAKTDAFGHIEILRSLLLILLITIQRNGEKPGNFPLSAAKPSHRLFIQFRKLLEIEYRTIHTVKGYADKLNVSTKTLSNSVQECSGKSPLSFINDRIILETKRLLRHTDMMVKEVAYYLGYEDPSYFVKLFKRETGFLPTDFKNGTCAITPIEETATCQL